MTDAIKDQIDSIFRTILEGKHIRVVLFGSQARNDASKASDYDFALDGSTEVERSIIVSLKEMFEESTVPYQIDIVDLNNVSEAMKNQINKFGKEWKYLG